MSIYFLRPWFLALIVPLVIIWVSLWLSRKRFSNWASVCDHHLLPQLLLSDAESMHRLPLILLGGAWLTSVIALAGPSFSKSNYSLYRNNAPQVLAIHLNADLYATDLRPNRLRRLRYKLLDIVHHQQEGQTGMMAFSRESFTISPLTDDAYTLSSMIPELDPKIMPVSGSNIAQAIDYAIKLLEQSGENKGHIILMTSAQPNQNDYRRAEQAHHIGYRVSVYGIGTQQGAPLITEQGFLKDEQGNIRLAKLDTTRLQHLARAGGGIYIPFSDDDQDIKTIRSLTSGRDAPNTISKRQLSIWHDQGRLLLFLICPLAALAFRRGWFETIVS